MKFMMIVKSAERSGFPPPALMEAINKLSQDAAKAGTMIGGGGLGPTALGARVRLSDGKITVTDGPFTEAKEVVGGLALLQANSKEEAIELVKEFLQVAGDGECELRQLFEAGACPGPEVVAAARPQLATAD